MSTRIAVKSPAQRVLAVVPFLQGVISESRAERAAGREQWRAFREVCALDDRSLADHGLLRRDVEAVSMWAARPLDDLQRVVAARKANS